MLSQEAQRARGVKVDKPWIKGEFADSLMTHPDSADIQLSATLADKSKMHLELWQSALQDLTEAFCLLDQDWRYIFVNKCWLDLVENLPATPIGKTIWEVFPHLRNSLVEENLQRVMRDRVQVRFEFYSIAAGGRWLEVRAYPVGDGIAYFSSDIHSQKKVEEEAIRSRIQFDAILEGVSSGVLAFNAAGDPIFINSIGASMAGYSSAEAYLEARRSGKVMEFKLFDEHGKPLDRSRLPSHLAFQGVKSPPEMTVQYQLAGSSEMKWSILKSKPVFDENGQLQMVVTIFTDFTDRKKAELERETYAREARLERSRLEAVLRQVETGVIIVDAKTKDAVFMNNKAREIWRWPDFPLTGNDRYKFLKGFRPDGTPMKPTDWTSYRAIEQKIAIPSEEVEILRRDGTRGIIESSTDLIRDADGEVVAAVVTLQDVTENRKQERAARFLDEATQILHSSLDYSTMFQAIAQLAVPKLADWCSVTIMEASGPNQIAIAHQDPKMLEIAEEFRQKYPTDWSSETAAAQVLRTGKSITVPVITDEMLVAGAKDPEHLRLLRALGIGSLILVPIKEREQIRGVLTLVSSGKNGHFGDADLKVAEELGRRAGQALENARLYHDAQNAIRSRDALVSVSAHELLTPVTGSKLQMQMIRRRLDQGRELPKDLLRKMVDQTERQLDRLDRLVNEMLDLSRINHGKLTIERSQTHLSELLNDIVERGMGQLRAAACRVSTKIEPGFVGFIDSYRIEQVVSNLLSNAARYARCSLVTVSLGRTAPDTASITVADTGIGIHKSDQERIFQRFERVGTINEGSGLGLGLFIVKQIVEAHGGRVTLESEFGKGSTFTVQLPLNGEDSP
jgi:signal transduction histidine kinase/PAS domain-containing protein